MRDDQEYKYEVRCENDHEARLTASELEDLLWEQDFTCSQCDETLSLESSLSLECHICDAPWDELDLEEAASALQDECEHCKRMGFSSWSFHMPDSWHMHMAINGWVRDGNHPDKLLRKGREDYWEGVVHFCTVNEFVSICKDGTIKASPTGYFRKPAVCLTEAPIGNWTELKETHGSFGFVFGKGNIIRAGGGPALYMPESLIRSQPGGLSDRIKPFVTLLRLRGDDRGRPRHDFLHEREWRIPEDIVLETMQPEGLVVDWSELTHRTPGWKHALSMIRAFEELDEE